MLLRVFSALSLGLTCLAAQAAVRVIDNQGKPVAGAMVLIGPAANNPFPGNQVVTDANGVFHAPAAWTQSLPVTIEGTDIVRTTHALVLPSVATLNVSQADGDQQIQLQGTLTDYGPIRTDGKVDVGAFIPALPSSDLLYFDVGWMVSPEFDTLKVLGREIAIPSNLALPKQQESYIFPITLDKPGFRMYVRKPGKYRFLAVHGQFPLKRAVDDLRAGVPVVDLVNHLTLVQSGLVDLDVRMPMADLSVPVTGLSFTNSITVQAPPMAADDVVMSVAFSTVDESGSLVPSDVKRLRSNQPQLLKAPATKSAPMALSAWMKQTANTRVIPQLRPALEDDLLSLPMDLIYSVFQNQKAAAATVNYNQVSFATHSQSGVAPRFIELVSPPDLGGDRIKLAPPAPAGGVLPVATLLLYSSITTHSNGKIHTESRTRLWELWLPGWASEAVLPSLAALPKGNAQKFRWEVLYLGKDNQGTIRSVGQDFTHVSRNSRDL